MKKLFLTSGLVLCMACPALATQDLIPQEGGGYLLDGTQNAPNCSTPNTLVSDIDPTTFYAMWEAHEYHVRYNDMAVANATTSTVTVANSLTDDVNFDDDYEIRNNSNGSVFTKQGYTFTGWLSDYNLATGAHTPITGENPTSYTVAWLANAQNNPVKFRVSQADEGDIVEMYAQWTSNKALIALNSDLYNAAGTEVIASPASGYKGTEQVWTRFDNGVFANNANAEALQTPITTITAPTLTGYTFGGYYTQKNGAGDPMVTVTTANDVTTIAFAAGLDNLSDGHAPTATITDPDATLYAKWTANGYTLTYNCGMNIAGTKSATPVANQALATSLTYPRTYDAAAASLYDPSVVCELAGYHVTPDTTWSCVKTGTDTAVTLASIQGTWKVDSDVTCTASWTPNTIGLTWKPGAGAAANTTNAGAESCVYDGSIGVAGKPTKAGYDFQGWTTNPQAEGVFLEQGN